MNSGDIGASDIWVIVKVTPCVAIGWCLEQLRLLLLLSEIAFYASHNLHILEQDSGNTAGTSHSLGSAYLTSGTSAITLWSTGWGPLRWDIENVSADEVISSVSKGSSVL